MKKLIIIPAYNESANIENTVKDIVNNAPDFDYVIINDCSTDNTLEICERNGFNVVNLPLNLGIGGAVQTGYRYAYNNGYDITLIQKLFNHSSPSVTLRYIGITQDELDDVYLSLDL